MLLVHELYDLELLTSHLTWFKNQILWIFFKYSEKHKPVKVVIFFILCTYISPTVHRVIIYNSEKHKPVKTRSIYR